MEEIAGKGRITPKSSSESANRTVKGKAHRAWEEAAWVLTATPLRPSGLTLNESSGMTLDMTHVKCSRALALPL